ncbi:MAG: hypothetical protein AAFX81_14725 [Pseudomonadota bacterium]
MGLPEAWQRRTIAVDSVATEVAAIFRSMVEISDRVDLLSLLGRINAPRSFVYGERSAGLSCLADVDRMGVVREGIGECEHLPAYANPQAMRAAIERAMARTETVPTP